MAPWIAGPIDDGCWQIGTVEVPTSGGAAFVRIGGGTTPGGAPIVDLADLMPAVRVIVLSEAPCTQIGGAVPIGFGVPCAPVPSGYYVELDVRTLRTSGYIVFSDPAVEAGLRYLWR